MRLSLFEVLSHPWMKSRCDIPVLLETRSLTKPPTNEYIMKFIPRTLGGNFKDKSGKDMDKYKVAYKRNYINKIHEIA